MCLRTYPLAHRRVLLRIAFQVGVKVCHQDDEVKCSVPQFGLGHLEWLSQPIEAHPLCRQKFISSIRPYKRHFFLCTWGQWFLADISEVSTLQTPCLSLCVWSGLSRYWVWLIPWVPPITHNFSFCRNCSEEAATAFSMPGLWFLMKKKKEWRYYSLLGPLNIDISSHQVLRALL